MTIDVTLLGMILGSSVLAGLVAAFAKNLLSRDEYKRDYHRDVFHRRLDAYERIYKIIGMLRAVVAREDGRGMHLRLIWGPDRYIELVGHIHLAMEESLWLDPTIRDRLAEMSRLLLDVPDEGTKEEMIEVAVQLYVPLGQHREALEEAVCDSLTKLHDVDRFLKRKRAVAAQGPKYRLEKLPRSAMLPMSPIPPADSSHQVPPIP